MRSIIAVPINTGFVRQELARRGWDTRRLASESGVAETTIWRAMRGGRVRPATLEAIAAAFRDHEARPELAALVSS